MKKLYSTPEIKVFKFEFSDQQTASPSLDPTKNPLEYASAKHSLIEMTDGYSDNTEYSSFYFNKTEFK